jgi:putative addiction module component (TIGR02574 family)
MLPMGEEAAMSEREALLQKALRLSEKERLRLAHALLSTVVEGETVLTEAQKAVLRERRAELRDRPTIGVGWAEAKKRLGAATCLASGERGQAAGSLVRRAPQLPAPPNSGL